MQPSISIKKITLGYRKGTEVTSLLADLEVQFFKGELIGIVGKNGVGKSTLLKSVAGLLLPLKGTIMLEGRDIQSLSLSELSREVAIVLTDRVSGFNLNTYDLVAAGQMPYTNSFHQLHEEHHRVIEAAVKQCDLEAYREKPLHELSDGLFQKASIARAIAQQTPVLLLDEPTAFLDFASKHKLFILLKELSSSGKTVLVSSHDLELIGRYCDKILAVDENETALLPVSEMKTHAFFKKITGGYL